MFTCHLSPLELIRKVVENEAATAVCRRLLRLERPSHADLNEVISNSLAGALVPTAAANNGGCGLDAGPSGGGMLHIGDKLAHLCCNKDFLFLRASMVPQARPELKLQRLRCVNFQRYQA